MLVQPALTTHLLCRPVSIADCMDVGEELQVLCGSALMCYETTVTFGKAFSNVAYRTMRSPSHVFDSCEGPRWTTDCYLPAWPMDAPLPVQGSHPFCAYHPS